MNHPLATRFWEHLASRFGQQPMLLDTSGQCWSYADISGAISGFRAELAQLLRSGKGLCALVTRNNVSSVVAYLGCLQSGHALMLLNSEMSECAVAELCQRYRVNLLIQTSEASGLSPALIPLAHSPAEVHPELALLLSTSGSSGSPKLVRLSYRNLQANAESIADFLSIRSEDRAIVHLPLHYSYGLSVLNSHLHKGASCVLYQGSVMERPFWQALKALSVNNIAGVPYTYEMLSRLRFEPSAYPALRYMTQAGGKLSIDLVTQFSKSLSLAGKQFFLMYGQTEATARMSYLPPALSETHPDSIGKPLPGGHFELRDQQGHVLQAEQQVGELVYRGDNVMMGYAIDYQDLAAGCTLDALATGDLAWRDEQGLYYLKGRKDRVRKILGNRIDLDELQERLQSRFGGLACVASDSHLHIFFEDETEDEALRQFLDTQLQLPPSRIIVQHLNPLPRTVNGKLDYAALENEGAA